MQNALINISYLVASVLFILGLIKLGHPRTAVQGNFLGALGMLIAIIATLFERNILDAGLQGFLVFIGDAPKIVLRAATLARPTYRLPLQKIRRHAAAVCICRRAVEIPGTTAARENHDRRNRLTFMLCNEELAGAGWMEKVVCPSVV